MKIILVLLAMVLLFGVGNAFLAPAKCSEDDQIDCADNIRAGTIE
jgi:hypothetical protein